MTYQYDTFGRLQKTGGGASATFHPTTYTYDATEGLLTKVSYDDGAAVKDAEYEYDNLARVTRILDWIDDVNGIQYQFDDANRLSKVIDYDGTESVSYAYDGAGRVTSMTDTHGGVTATTNYTYDVRGLLDTLTAPGNKTWDIDYNDLGQPTDVTLPNGMVTEYGYDSRDRMVSIAHKESAAGSVLQSFDYTLDDGGLIDRIDQAGGSWWEYEYDARYRLTKANRHNKPTNPTITATYQYTYNDGDNLTTKVTPFEDNFNDGNLTGWTVSNTWDLSNYTAKNDVDAVNNSTFEVATTDPDVDITFAYTNRDTSGGSFGPHVDSRWVDGNNRVQVRFLPGTVDVMERVGGTWSQLAANTAFDTIQDKTYRARIEFDGSKVTVWRDDGDGGLMQEVLSTTVTHNTNSRVRFLAYHGGQIEFDDVRIIAGDLDRTATFAYNAANELTSMTDYNGTTNFTYDAWGRTTQKTRGADTATYAYRYGSMLHTADLSNWQSGQTVTYEYGGTRRMRERAATNGDYSWYNWAGFVRLNEEIQGAGLGDGALATTSYGLGEISGPDPSIGDLSIFAFDHLGSMRASYDGSAVQTASHAYTPFGNEFSMAGLSGNARYALHSFDELTGNYLAPLRNYTPAVARWSRRDPAGFVDGLNVYSYVRNNPLSYYDPTGGGLQIAIPAGVGTLAAGALALGGAIYWLSLPYNQKVQAYYEARDLLRDASDWFNDTWDDIIDRAGSICSLASANDNDREQPEYFEYQLEPSRLRPPEPPRRPDFRTCVLACSRYKNWAKKAACLALCAGDAFIGFFKE